MKRNIDNIDTKCPSMSQGLHDSIPVVQRTIE
jgi:hypothetical protein